MTASNLEKCRSIIAALLPICFDKVCMSFKTTQRVS
jgi:hypothetical protein